MEDTNGPDTWTIEDVKTWAEKTFSFGICLSRALVENDVDGSILLNHVTDTELKADIGIKSLGQRVKILEKIRALQSKDWSKQVDRSLRSQEAHSRMAFKRPSDMSMSAFTQYSQDNVKKPIEVTLHATSAGQLYLQNVADTPKSILSNFKAQRLPPTPTSPPTPIPRRNNDMEDGPPMDATDAMDELDEVRQSTLTGEDGSPLPESPSPLKRRLQKLKGEEGQNQHRNAKKRKLMSAYFRTEGMRAADVMFPLEEGEATRQNIFVDNISNISHPTGERLYVQSLMRKLFLNPDIIEFTHDNRSRTVWKLHSADLVKKHEQHMALVFDVESPDDCKVFKAPVDVLRIPEPSRRPGKDHNGIIRFHYDEPENPFDVGGDWGYLSKWNHMEDDKLLPLFNESDSEDGGYDHATLREMEMEQRQMNGKPEPVAKPLSIDTVREVIAEELKRFEESWEEKELPKWEAREYRVYMKQHKRKSKKRTVSKYRRELEKLETRIEVFKAEYEAVDWRSANELKKICVNMRETVHQIQELQWQVELLSGPPPERPINSNADADAIDDSVDEMMDIIDDGAKTGGEEADDEDLDDDDEESFDEDEDMEGFVIPDNEIDMALLEDVGGFGDQEDLDDTDDDEDKDLELSTPKRSGNRGKRVVVSESDGDDKPEEIEDKEDTMIEDTEGIQEPLVEEDSVELPVEDIVRSPSRDTETQSTRSRRPLSSVQGAAETLPTPPHETDEDRPPTQIKQERSAPPVADDVPNLSDYDSDIFMSFGDKEISNFCQCTEKSHTVAKSYLLKADGHTKRAIEFYYEDLDNGNFEEPRDTKKASGKKPATNPPAVTLSPLKTRGQRKDKFVKNRKDSESIPLDTDDEEKEIDKSNGSHHIYAFKSVFDDIFPPDGKVCLAVKNLVSSLKMRDLHDTVIEVANLLTVKKGSQLMGSFIAGETPLNCHAYMQIYTAYAWATFAIGSASVPYPRMDKVRDAQLFEKFYEALVSYLGIEPAPVPVEGKVANKYERQSSPLSQLEPGPSNSLRGKKKPKKEKKKEKPNKIKIIPVTKSAEQISQEAELRRLADREREQKKKGDIVTVAPDGSVLVNLFHKKTEDSVWLHPKLATVLKTHQIEGLQFMWKQIAMISTKKAKGCLLAHTMGLGKTLQIIALLITLSLLPEKVRMDMPPDLKKRNKKFLIVCPPGIVNNWANEFKKWTPRDCVDDLGHVHCINDASLYARMNKIERWFEIGGVLIMGYSQFRALLNPKKNVSKEQLASLSEWLLDPGPDLVVADEAHEIKNESSKITGILKRIRTGSRIATTGSPLSNNLKEYWAMMNWIHMGFLGTLRSFTDIYIEPIKAGLYADSSSFQRKISQRRLVHLKQLLNGKIHRCDLSVIASDLPSKTEFVVYVPLTKLQRTLYEGLVNNVKFDGNGALFKWINILRLICNHPYTLMDYLRKEAERAELAEADLPPPQDKGKGKEVERDPDADESEAPSRQSSPDTLDEEVLPVIDELQWAKDIFKDLGDEYKRLKYTEYSNKARMVMSIVKEAVKMKENTLIFVHSIPTLDYLREKLDHKGYTIFELTGQTPMKDRQPAIDRFNRLRGAVYLISCRAGSLGLNITSANRVILYDLAWNPVHDQQAVGRAYRLGQKKPVFVYRLGIFGTYEEVFFTENIFKLNLSKRVIDKHNPGRFGVSSNLDIKKYFQPPKEDADVLYDKEVFEKKDAILDELMKHSESGAGPKILELDLTETFHKDEEESYLTPEELQAVNEEAEKEKKMREEGIYVESRHDYLSSHLSSGIPMQLFPGRAGPSVVPSQAINAVQNFANGFMSQAQNMARLAAVQNVIKSMTEG